MQPLSTAWLALDHRPPYSAAAMVVSAKPRRPNMGTPKRQTTLSAGSFSKGTPKPVKAAQPNSSILSFFKKTDKPDDSLFVGATPETLVHDDKDGLYGSGDADRFNEFESPEKKRRIAPDPETTSREGHVHEDALGKPPTASASSSAVKSGGRRVQGPFIMDSDSEEEEDDNDDCDGGGTRAASMNNGGVVTEEHGRAPVARASPTHLPQADATMHPTRTHTHEQGNSPNDPYHDLEDFAEIGQVDDGDLDMFEGEEMREMRYMREQARLEAEESNTIGDSSFGSFDNLDNDGTADQCCPMCQGSIAQLSPEEATRHVNLCIDGTAPPLPSEPVATPTQNHASSPPLVDSSGVSERFSRRAIPRPAQVNPLEATPPNTTSRSAFSKIMSNNAEDSAWSTAATAEKSSRGRPTYERTCPFYKIIPGFSISVDAFRYGAIEGCKGYFLSHFHSDHYIGLTAKWCHGPIYCSKVTGRLVRQQLKTADKWVVELDFEKQYDIPGTDGATVTMIPANHCPGSSLFLFQKPLNGSYTRRILHCGDFRACPEHVEHPDLKPDVVDAVSGKIRQQKIDICYLDTTYLSPRYSFPPQEDVIQACASLCASISPDPACRNDILSKPIETEGTPGVSKYFQKDDAIPDHVVPSAGGKVPKQRLLVVCGTYSIGKERICIAIAKALNSKIYASPGKIKLCQQLGMPELNELLTSDPLEAQVHMQMLMEIRGETLQDYLNSYKPHFSRIVGFRPSGWNFRPSKGNTAGANTPPSTIPTRQLLHGKEWRNRFGCKNLVAQRGSTSESLCFAVPYSEHSSFRELSMFVMGLRIEKIIPTVNVGSAQSRSRMKAWNDRWISERKKYGLIQPLVEGRDDQDQQERELWEGKPGKGGGVWW